MNQLSLFPEDEQSAFPWSQQQLELFAEAKKGKNNIAVEAVAGSGKSSSIRGLIATLPSTSKIAIMAFNRHTADKFRNEEVIPKKGRRIHIGTAHGLGLSLLIRFFGGKKLDVQNNKYNQIAKDVAAKIINYRSAYEYDRQNLTPEQLQNKWMSPPPRFDEKTPQGKAEIKKFTDFIKEVAEYAMKTLTLLSVEDIIKMIKHFNLEIPFTLEIPEEIALHWGAQGAIEAIDIGGQKARDIAQINCDEMLYLPYRWNIEPAKKDWIIVDEAQDASPAQIALYKSYVDKGAQIIYIGDRRQAIQGFAGSDAYSWQKLEEAFKPKLLPLSVCYRCASSHISLAQRIVPQIEARTGAKQGTVETASYDVMLTSAKAGDLIICRLNAPLIKTYLKLMTTGTKAAIRGQDDIGKSLVSLATKASGAVNWPSSFSMNLSNYVAQQINDLMWQGKEKKAELLRDERDSLNYLFDEFGLHCHTFDDFCNKIKKLSCDNKTKDLVILSSIHRAKGDEAEVVWVLGSNLLPFTDKCMHEWQKEQEINLVYVALTRSKKSLYLVPYSNKPSQLNSSYLLQDPLGGMKLPDLQQKG